MNLQDAFLNQVRVTKTPVSVFLMGGHQLRGLVTGFDSFILIMDIDGKEQLVYKHAVTTVTPQKKLNFMTPNDKKEASKPQEQPDEQAD